MPIFTIFLQNFSKIFSKTHHFLKNFLGGACLRTPLANASLRQIPPLFHKYFEPPPPPK